MCGISVVVHSSTAVARPAIDRMVARLAHRGPDANDSTHVGSCSLGHARLSIIDLATGSQPMSDEAGRFWISFNGEIYNYRDLHRELAAAGHRFRTTSDTEVLLVGFREWGGDELLRRLRGMFAFAIWDRVTETIFAARDLFGEKPLYFATASDTLLIASELKALLASALVQADLDPVSVDGFLALGYVPPDRTIYRNISTLPPGHTLTWQRGVARVAPYWTPTLKTQQVEMRDAAAELRQLIERAVQRQMVADVPVGAFLSGGLDSSTIVGLMQRHSSIPVKTFSVGFGKMINELPYARAVAKMYSTEHHEIDLGEPNVAPLLERMAEVYDEPFADSSHVPTYLLAQFARRSVKVALSGDGGDELFGGYWWYPPLAMSTGVSFALLQWVVLRSVARLLGGRSRRLTIRSHAAGLAARWGDVFDRDVASQTLFSARRRRRLWESAEPHFVPGEYYRPKDDVEGLNRAFHFDLTSYLPGDILVKVDRAAMAHGLETRAPFLDRDVVEFALSLPPALKVDGPAGKVVLKEACRDLWPRELWHRQKQGFGAPIVQWLEQPEMQPLLNRVFAAGSPLRRLLPGIRPADAERRDFRTWTLLTLGLWLERHEGSS